MGEFFCEKGCFPGPLCDAGGESSLECLDFGLACHESPFPKPLLSLRGLERPPSPPPDTNHFSPSLGHSGAMQTTPATQWAFRREGGRGGGGPGPPPKSGKFEIP